MFGKYPAMTKYCFVLAIVLCPDLASARPGFAVGLGLGGSAVSGENVAFDRLSSRSGDQLSGPPGFTFNTDVGGGLAALFTMSYNILGYAAVETRLTGQGNQLGDADHRQWAAQWHTGVRAYPLWHWQAKVPELLQPLEPSLFIGWGASYEGYVATPSNEVAWSTWSSWRFGLGVEYFVLPFFKVGLDYSYVVAPYLTFIYDWDDSDIFDVEPSANTGFHQLFVVGTFQFSPQQ